MMNFKGNVKCTEMNENFILFLEFLGENLNSREGRTESTPVDKFHFTQTAKGVQCYPYFIIEDPYI